MSRILIVRACAIGDFVLNLPALRSLHQTRTDARFTLVGYPATLDLAREFVPVDAVYSIEADPWSRLFYGSISGLSFDSAIVWMKDPAVAENLRASGINDVVRADPFPAYGHAATHLLRTLGLSEPPLPDLWEPETEDIVIHASSGSAKKNWPHFDELVSRLGRAGLSLWERPPEGRVRVAGFEPTCDPHPALLFVAASGRSPRADLSQRERCAPRILVDLSLTEVSQHLRRCRAYVGNDSGITHLAAYLGCPAVALFGPTDPRIWGPIGRRSRIIWKTNLEDISVDEVLLALQCRTQNDRQT